MTRVANPFFRYALDALTAENAASVLAVTLTMAGVHRMNRSAGTICWRSSTRARLRECGLELHPETTRII